MTTIEVFEPALCCTTGVCGPDVDQALVTFSADTDWLRGEGGDVRRVNLAGEPAAFAANDAARRFLQLAGSGGLPLVLVDGVTALTGRYPTRAELAAWAAPAVATEAPGVQPDAPTTVATALPTAVPTAPDGVALLSLVDASTAGAPDDGACCGGGGCC